ncbi:MAG: hypothetical protein E7307_01320 [Butyrivibrio sp.]|nr:hypothetical protein [Butyrivibrio sp.]
MKRNIAIALVLITVLTSACGVASTGESQESANSDVTVDASVEASVTEEPTTDTDSDNLAEESATTEIVEEVQEVEEEPEKSKLMPTYAPSAKERYGSRFNVLSVGERMDLVTKAVPTMCYYAIHITLKEKKDNEVVFTIGVDDVFNGSEPIKVVKFSDIYEAVNGYLWFFYDESPMAISVSSEWLSADKDYTIGYGEEKDVTLKLPSSNIKYIGMMSYGTEETFGAIPADYDWYEDQERRYYYYITVFELPE